VAFLREHADGDLLAWFGYEPAVRAMEQGRPLSLDDLSPATRTALGALQDRLDAQPRHWARYTRQAAEFHLKNARAWASAAAGKDLAGQIDRTSPSGRTHSLWPRHDLPPTPEPAAAWVADLGVRGRYRARRDPAA
jgi:hypothetical protein